LKTRNPNFPYLERATKGSLEYEQRNTTAPRAILRAEKIVVWIKHGNQGES